MKIFTKWLLLLAVPVVLIGCSGTPGQTNSGSNSSSGSGSNSTPGSYTIGGTVTGLTGSGLVLQDDGGDNLNITGSGTFTFKTGLASGKSYAVTIATQPSNPNQTCSVTGGSGTATANVSSVQVACAVPNALISASVSGLSSPGLVLQDNGGDSLTINSSGTFQFKTPVTGAYSITVLTQPPSPTEICTVANGSGIATSATVIVNVSCSLSYTIGGTINGLVGTGLVLQDNGGDNLSITASGSTSNFAFKTQLVTGSSYAVSILTEPSSPAQNCTVTNGSGTAIANVSSVTINCPAVTFSVGGQIVGLLGRTPTPPTQVNLPLNDNSFALQNNNGDNFNVTQNGPFNFATPVALNGAFNATVFTAPSTQNQLCWSFNYKGVVTANVTSILIDCGHNDWAWIGGTKTAGTITAPQYGSFPSSPPSTIPNPYTNTPGARNGGAGWTDNNGNLWLFGGQGWELSGNPSPDTLYGNLNDMWECQVVITDTNHCQWQLVNGYNATPYSFPPATTLGQAIILLAQHEDNIAFSSGALTLPASRWGAATWTDSSKTKLWLFGGNGNGAQLLNDLWKFDTSSTALQNAMPWTLVSGDPSGGNHGGVYSGGSPMPGSRWGAVTWTDQSGNFWLFGGYGYDGSANVGFLNDLWEFNGTTWTFVSGGTTSTINQAGSYTGPTPYPGGRQSAVGWVDASGNLWLFGGEGEDANKTPNGVLNDLWEYNITGGTWTFVAGSSTANQTGVYGNQPLIGPPSVSDAAGTVGLPVGTAGTLPGSRWGAVAWTDFDGTLWLFGGWGLDSTGTNGNGALNDLWAFDTATKTWTWVKGSVTGDQNGVYGSLTRPYAPNVNWSPGGRNEATYWIDNVGQLWLFGGEGYDSSSSTGNGFLNDLWRYLPYP